VTRPQRVPRPITSARSRSTPTRKDGRGEEDAALQVRILGPFALCRGGTLVRLPKKAQALLAYLAINRPKAVTKEILATLLWGHTGTAQARASLRQCLVALRTALGAQADLLVADTETLLLADASTIVVDAADFLSASRSEHLPDLQDAIALYRDVFLAGTNIPIEPFERWLSVERQRFEAERLGLLQRLATGYAAAGETDRAVAACRELLTLDPLREEAHRLLMTVLANAGNRGGALLQYEQCVEVVKDELGIAPDPETVKLAEAIRLGVLRETKHPLPSGIQARRPETNTPGPGSTTPGPPLPDRPSVAVVPFANLNGDPSQDYFVRGLVEDIIVALGREKWLFVIASPSAFALEDSGPAPRSVGAKLGVQYVLKGSVRIDGGQLLFVVQLLDAVHGTHVHSYLGNTETAIEHFRRAQRLNPLDLSQHLHWNTVAWAYLGAGRYEEAADAAERTLRVQPDYLPGLRLKAVTCALLGRTDEAQASTFRLLEKLPTTTISWMRAFLQVLLQRNMRALETYLEGARLAGVPQGT